MGRVLVAVVAHPDDDTFGCAGTVALHADEPGFRFVLVHATSGEAGMIADPTLATRDTLGPVREREDRDSWSALGREPDRHEFLRLPDGGVADSLDALSERVAAILREERPDVVITFGPEGITGHADHIAVGRATTDAFRRVREQGGEGLRRLLHQALPQSSLDEWNARLIAQGREPMDPTQPFQPRGVPDASVGVVVDCTSVARRKVEALRAHRTQAADIEGWSDDEQLEVASRETHVIAWPPRDTGAPVLDDVFRGLDPEPIH